MTSNRYMANIEHLVLCGGGSFGYIEYGILSESSKWGFWKHENIKTLYATSAGAIFGSLILLGVSWEACDAYIYKRPWQTVYAVNPYTILNAIGSCGILNETAIIDTFTPMLKAKGLSPNVTLQELYEFNKIDMHFYTTDLTTFESVDLSHTTHPHWKLTEAVYASCSLPFLFAPFKKEGAMYFDGSTLCNFPLNHCIAAGYDKSTIFAINKFSPNVTNEVTEEMEDKQDEFTLFDYMNKILFSALNKLVKEENIDIPYKMEVKSNFISIMDIYLATSDQEERKKVIDYGIQCWREFADEKGIIQHGPSRTDQFDNI